MFAASVRLYNSFNIIKSIGNINRERIDYNNTNHLFDRSSTVITPEQGRDLLSFKVKKINIILSAVLILGFLVLVGIIPVYVAIIFFGILGLLALHKAIIKNLG